MRRRSSSSCVRTVPAFDRQRAVADHVAPLALELDVLGEGAAHVADRRDAESEHVFGLALRGEARRVAHEVAVQRALARRDCASPSSLRGEVIEPDGFVIGCAELLERQREEIELGVGDRARTRRGGRSAAS
jgi:hypothetical protein